MARIKDFTEEYPMDKFSGTDPEKENPYKVKVFYPEAEQRAFDEHKDFCNGCALCEL